MRMTALLTAARNPGALSVSEGVRPRDGLTVQAVYEAHVAFVWRVARRLGVRPPQLDDIVQEVFMVVQRRLPDFEGRSSVRTWLYSITRHVVRAYFRLNRRKPQALCADADAACDSNELGPESQLLANEGRKLLYALLDELDDDKREVFVLAQLEEMTGPEIAQALELPLNNVYSRIEAAQKAFDRGLKRQRARQRDRP
jgi:RNA polymerase sigma-70 factor (ECF subfamily)